MPIINDVEVEKCIYAILSKSQCPAKSMPYAKETSCIACKEHNTKLNFCKNNPNCYFKQLMIENEELKSRLKILDEEDFVVEVSETEFKRFQELKKENEELKIQLKILEALSSPKILTNETLNMMMFDKAQKYETVLEEIRDIAKEGSKSVFADEDCDKIIDKIDEVLK